MRANVIRLGAAIIIRFSMRSAMRDILTAFTQGNDELIALRTCEGVADA
jgi:hypothetical protein